tara:strand:- start:19174 stop:20040 length:867 start_codon:yes stop_codon:yes gene_type:complete
LDWNTPQIETIIDNWILEDIGSGDLTKSCITKEIGQACWISKQDGVFCGVEIIKKIFNKIDNNLKFSFAIKDGEKFKKNQNLLELTGPAISLLASERIALNIAMHLSGITTHTYKLVKKIKHTKIKLADTRKTTPGLRILEKYAFRCGGGINHRMGLYDAAMLKENHIAWSDNLFNAIKQIRLNTPFTTHIIVEAENIKQAKEAILAGADSILLDEIEVNLLKENIKILKEISLNKMNKNAKKDLTFEVSGINPQEIEKYLIDGIDFISTSSGSTKSQWIDFSMRYID